MVDDHHGGDHNEQSKAAQTPLPPPPVGNNSSMPATPAMAEAKIKLIMEEHLKLSPSRNNGTNSVAGSGNNSSAGAASQGRSHANVFVKSKNSFKTPLISQEKFHWDQVSCAQGNERRSFKGLPDYVVAFSSAEQTKTFPLSNRLNDLQPSSPPD